jgi:aryl-alcohol dehydrogenase-like predicted oxidoreductase
MVEYLNLGNTGMEVSEACLGTWMFGMDSSAGSEIVSEEEALSIMDAAWAGGVNFLDTANVYGSGGRSEKYIGKERIARTSWSPARSTSLFRVDSGLACPARS